MLENDLVEVHDIHDYLEDNLKTLKRVKPSDKAQEKYFEKNPAAWYRECNNSIDTGQKIKRDGEGNTASQHKAMADMLKLGIQDQIKLLHDLASKSIEYGIKMGYKPVEIREAQVVPEDKGKNRLEEGK